MEYDKALPELRFEIDKTSALAAARANVNKRGLTFMINTDIYFNYF